MSGIAGARRWAKAKEGSRTRTRDNINFIENLGM
jgi:hypothetical protein